MRDFPHSLFPWNFDCIDALMFNLTRDVFNVFFFPCVSHMWGFFLVATVCFVIGIDLTLKLISCFQGFLSSGELQFASTLRAMCSSPEFS